MAEVIKPKQTQQHDENKDNESYPRNAPQQIESIHVTSQKGSWWH